MAALRSPAFACSDLDLLRWRDARGPWNYRSALFSERGRCPTRVQRDASPETGQMIRSLSSVRSGTAQAVRIQPDAPERMGVSRLITEFILERRLDELDLVREQAEGDLASSPLSHRAGQDAGVRSAGEPRRPAPEPLPVHPVGGAAAGGARTDRGGGRPRHRRRCGTDYDDARLQGPSNFRWCSSWDSPRTPGAATSPCSSIRIRALQR